MSTVRVVAGSGTGPTPVASYDAALADAGVHDYNLVVVSSVLPADVTLTVAGTAPDLGPAGDRLTVVQSEATVEPIGGNAERAGADGTDAAVAGLGWARSADGPGIFYEETGRDEDAVRQAITTGLEHGVGLREWDVADSDVVLRRAEPVPEAYATAVVLAVYGESEPIV